MSARGAAVQCEMGGQNASVVLADADLDAAARTIAAAAMGYAGQKCTATSRVIAEAPIARAVAEALRAAVDALDVEGPERDECAVGPLITRDARDDAADAVARAADAGGRVVTGGVVCECEGHYLFPTLVELEDRRAELAQEEVFGPVCAVLTARDAAEAVAIANDVRFGLSASVFTRDLDRALALTRSIEAGLVRVNAPTSGVDLHAPFGGEKASGIGPREQGTAARELYTQTRTVLVSPAGAG